MKMTSTLMILSMIAQPLAQAADAQAMNQVQIQFAENVQTAKSYVESRMQERFSALYLKEQRSFLDQSERYLGRLERRLERISDRRFDRRLKRVSRVLEKKAKKQQLLADETAEVGLVEVPETELKGYWATYRKIMVGETESAAISGETQTPADRTLDGLKQFRSMNRNGALQLVEKARKSIGQLQVAVNDRIEGKANRLPADVGVEGLMLLMLLFVYFIPAIVFVVAAILVGGVILWVLACAAAVFSIYLHGTGLDGLYSRSDWQNVIGRV